MRELRDILDAFDRLSEAGESAVLASVVGTTGSTYRRPGARTLILPDERTIGLVSGGCLEGDLLLRSRRVRASGTPELVEYDATREDDVLLGLGLGCGGVVRVWLERVDACAPGPLAFLRSCFEERLAGALALELTGPQRGRWSGVRGDGWRWNLSESETLERGLRETLRTGRHAVLEGPQRETAFESVPILRRLVVFGAGPDAAPLSSTAIRLGWDVTITDARPAGLTASRFPGARLRESSFERAAKETGVDPDTFTVVMTHHYLHDLTVLRSLLSHNPRYIGMLGPKHRFEDLIRELREEGMFLDGDQLDRIYAPAGLDLGADAPDEIAIAVVAEMQAVAAERTAGFLRDRKGPIHAAS